MTRCALLRCASCAVPAVQAVQKQVAEQVAQEEAAAALEDDPEAKQQAEEARRAREAEEWRLQQLRTGAVGENANFAVREAGGQRGAWCMGAGSALAGRFRWVGLMDAEVCLMLASAKHSTCCRHLCKS